MVTDFEAGRLLGELQDLEDEIETISSVVNHPDYYKYDWQLKRLTRILDKLNFQKERLEIRLKQHRQKVKESRVKF